MKRFTVQVEAPPNPDRDLWTCVSRSTVSDPGDAADVAVRVAQQITEPGPWRVRVWDGAATPAAGVPAAAEHYSTMAR